MKTTAITLTIVLLSACGSAPAYGGSSYEPPPPSRGGENASPTADNPPRDPTLDQESRTAELSERYPGPGDAPSPYEAQDQLATGSEAYAAAASAKDVHLNGRELSEPDFRELEVRLGRRPEAGHFWYDARSGLWGLDGHGAGGVTLPGLRAPALQETASRGNSGVRINGRMLTQRELQIVLELLGWDITQTSTYLGSYTLDADGKLHKVGGRYMGNLSAKAEKARAAGKYNDASLECAITQLGTTNGVLGRGVTINCD